MANANLTFEEMERVAGALATGEENLNTELGTLKSTVDGLIANGFTTDSASGQFQTAYDEFTTGVTQVLTGLTEMSTYLKSVATQYRELDQNMAAQTPLR